MARPVERRVRVDLLLPVARGWVVAVVVGVVVDGGTAVAVDATVAAANDGFT